MSASHPVMAASRPFTPAHCKIRGPRVGPDTSDQPAAAAAADSDVPAAAGWPRRRSCPSRTRPPGAWLELGGRAAPGPAARGPPGQRSHAMAPANPRARTGPWAAGPARIRAIVDPAPSRSESLRVAPPADRAGSDGAIRVASVTRPATDRPPVDASSDDGRRRRRPCPAVDFPARPGGGPRPGGARWSAVPVRLLRRSSKWHGAVSREVRVPGRALQTRKTGDGPGRVNWARSARPARHG